MQIKHVLALLLASASLSLFAQPWMRPQGPLNEFSPMEGTSVLTYNLPMERDIHSRAGYGPAFYIFADQKLNEQTALSLANELNIIEIAKTYSIIEKEYNNKSLRSSFQY